MKFLMKNFANYFNAAVDAKRQENSLKLERYFQGANEMFLLFFDIFLIKSFSLSGHLLSNGDASKCVPRASRQINICKSIRKYFATFLFIRYSDKSQVDKNVRCSRVSVWRFQVNTLSGKFPHIFLHQSSRWSRRDERAKLSRNIRCACGLRVYKKLNY